MNKFAENRARKKSNTKPIQSSYGGAPPTGAISASQRWIRLVELIILFVAAPALFFFDVIKLPKVVPLFAAAVYAMVVLLFDKKFERRLLRFKKLIGFKRILIRFFVVALILAAYTAIFEHGNLFILPRQKPLLWVMIMVFYPIWSVLPQEIIYRVFFFHRYQYLFKSSRVIIVANALLFAWLHVIFNNWIALAGGFITGILWAHTYRNTRSLSTVGLEHTVYGNYIYTLGIGHYFYVPDF